MKPPDSHPPARAKRTHPPLMHGAANFEMITSRCQMS
jgi:hypothetical protein